MKLSQGSKIIATVLLVLTSAFSIYLLQKGNTASGIVGLLLSLALIVLLIFLKPFKQKIPFDQIKTAYINYMELKEKISLPPDSLVYKLAEEGTRYVFVLKGEWESVMHYYMAEADFYTGEWGRGIGEFTDKETAALDWFNKRKRTDVVRTLLDEIRKQSVQKMLLDSKRNAAEMNKLNSEGKQ